MEKFNAEFWKWFGKSKVVDEHGQPLIVWRGDGEDFHVFDRRKNRENAIFFTPVKEVAQIYAGKRHGPKDYYLKLVKFLDLASETTIADKFIRKWAKRFDEWVDRQSGEEVDPVDEVRGGRLFDYEGDWSSERWLDLQGYIEAQGYDGAALPDWDNDIGMFPAIIVFDPHNIKSVDNDGGWDRDDVDVRSNPRRRAHCER